VKKWAILRDRLVEIAKVMWRFPWMVEVVRQSQVSILYPYMYRSVHSKGRVGGVHLAEPAEGVLRPKRSCEGDAAGAGV